MARYIDADALLKKIFPFEGVDKRTYPINAQAIYNVIMNAPTENVVPKDELLKCREGLKAVLDEIPETKRELAMEIFEDIEREIKNHGICYAQRKIAELKKKYTEAE